MEDSHFLGWSDTLLEKIHSLPLILIVPICLLSLASCQNAQAQSPEATIFVTHYLERGSTSTEPRPDQLKDKISVSATPGEYEPVTVSVRAATELKKVSATLTGDLVSETGDVIPASAVDIRLVDPFESWTKKNMEFFLLSKDTVDIPAQTTRRFWLTIHVPTDARPGLYRSKILIGKPVTRLGPDLGRHESIEVLDYEVNVLPIKLLSAQETGMAFFMYNDTAYYHSLSPELVSEEYQTKVFEDMREHGMTTATVYLYPDVDGKFTLTGRSEKHLGFDQTMAMLEKTDLIAPGMPVIWIGAKGYGPDEWKGVLEQGRKKNWPEILFYAVDEPRNSKLAKRVRQFMKRFNTFRRENLQYNLRVTTGLLSSRGTQMVGHYYDLWIACMAQKASGVIADAKMQKKELWVYDCKLAPMGAETERYFFGVWSWVSGVKGCSYWAYFDNSSRFSFVYPAKDQLIPSIGWEGVREGIDDYRYLATLKQLSDQVKSAGNADLAEGADQIFEEVKRMVTLDNYSKAYNSADPYHRPRIEPDLAIDAYDHMRTKVAREIEKISSAMSK